MGLATSQNDSAPGDTWLPGAAESVRRVLGRVSAYQDRQRTRHLARPDGHLLLTPNPDTEWRQHPVEFGTSTSDSIAVELPPEPQVPPTASARKKRFDDRLVVLRGSQRPANDTELDRSYNLLLGIEHLDGPAESRKDPAAVISHERLQLSPKDFVLGALPSQIVIKPGRCISYCLLLVALQVSDFSRQLIELLGYIIEKISRLGTLGHVPLHSYSDGLLPADLVYIILIKIMM